MRILFVCSGNTCRSPMAQALLQKILEDRQDKQGGKCIEVSSAGMGAFPGQSPSREAVETMRHYDVDLSYHRSRVLDLSILSQADWILTMTRSQCNSLREKYPALRMRIFTMMEFAGQEAGDIEDPFGRSLEIYQACAVQIVTLVEKILVRL
ncbi:MAG TPA: low molecular weight protein arginine phosphatase [Syntrophomonadaceae bacterium]|nr:low molecular weight protein arginine phosphatase [Syntrophomonadaceae bacterium]